MSVNINGNTGVSQVQDTIVSQGKLGAGVAGNGPAFSAYRSVNQGVANATWTKVSCDLEEFDTANSFDSVTNSRFQPTVAGYYQLSGSISYITSNWSGVSISIYKNGSPAKGGSNTAATLASGYVGCNVSALIYLNGSTDYVELWGYCSATTPGFVAGANSTYFQGYLARSA